MVEVRYFYCQVQANKYSFDLLPYMVIKLLYMESFQQ
jgi:hypothetical protein